MAKASAPETDHPPAPNAWLMALEMRAPWELWSLLPSWPALAKAPTGDGHPVIVFPGLSASDGSTLPLRSYLKNLGYDISGWNQGYNFGPRAGVLETAKRQVQETADASGERVSLVGWSLGGIYARELAKALPDHVRSVITLGSPFSGSHKSTNAWRLYELTSGRSITQEVENFDLPAAPPVPTTSIYSRTDGVVAWSASLQAPSKTQPKTENVEVFASHIGLGLNPTAWWVVADRLAQAPGAWQPFEPTGRLQQWVFPNPKQKER
ncbi:alpha/beta hydrolase [Rhodoferax saidenbachensis]|uniref:Pimeloyl-ACP methyl ester carboxylesterase n=1 Tax=Rhodoferax saidenbachensis TaxID=1484693 RepID=A0ABU1ZMD8_9BURK|nr:alpha/beta hydrolase [Rhodoferax saidenbachensis]MDR7306699.1 pimeloyl-ACP methyl ester carboxylesterase [Rhodoferax saidenbachensis]